MNRTGPGHSAKVKAVQECSRGRETEIWEWLNINKGDKKLSRYPDLDGTEREELEWVSVEGMEEGF